MVIFVSISFIYSLKEKFTLDTLDPRTKLVSDRKQVINSW